MEKNLKLDKYAILLVLILVVALVIRISFLSDYQDQPAWWDESEHLVMAKHLASDTPLTGWNVSREILIPVIFSFFFKLFGSELSVRVLQLVFSLGIVLATYLVGTEIFDKKIGLISASMMAVFYLNLFFMLRFGLEMIAPFFALMTIFFFWKGYVNKKGKYSLPIAGIFGSLAFMASAKEALLLISIVFFLIFVYKFEFLRNKKLWFALIVGLILLAPYMLYYNNVTGNLLPRGTTTTAAINTDLVENNWSWGNFMFFINFIPNYLQSIWFWVFLIGLFVILTNLTLGFDLTISNKEPLTKKYLFLLLWAILPLMFFSYPLGIAPNNYGEPRFMLEIIPAILIMTSVGLMAIFSRIKTIKFPSSISKYSNHIALVILLSLLIIGAVAQLNFAKATIESRANSFNEVKLAGLWIKDNSNSLDKVISASAPQNTYYSERETTGPPGTEEEFLNLVNQTRPKFMVVSIFEPHPNWYLDWPVNNQNSIRAVQGYTSTDHNGQERPLLVIYEFINYDFLPLSSSQ